MDGYMYIYTVYSYIYIYMYICMYMCVCIYICIYVSMYLCISMYIYLSIYLPISTLGGRGTDGERLGECASLIEVRVRYMYAVSIYEPMRDAGCMLRAS